MLPTSEWFVWSISFSALPKSTASPLENCSFNSSNDSCTLATKMDGVMMVIEAENTRWEVARSAKDRIESEKVKLLGVVLKRRKMYIPDWAYKML